MTPIFLPHTFLDAMSDVLPSLAAIGHLDLCRLRDSALAEGAHVMLLAWPTLEWVLLAVEVPTDVVIENPGQLIPNLMANPIALAHMRDEARHGRHLTWLSLSRPAATEH